MKLPIELINRIQYDYASEMYRSGAPVFNSLDESTVSIVISSLLEWTKEKNYFEDNKIDFSLFTLND